MAIIYECDVCGVEIETTYIQQFRVRTTYRDGIGRYAPGSVGNDDVEKVVCASCGATIRHLVTSTKMMLVVGKDRREAEQEQARMLAEAVVVPMDDHGRGH